MQAGWWWLIPVIVIGSLITIGKSELIAEIYLDLASVHESQGDVSAALDELQECLDLVTLGEGPDAQAGPRALWRVLLRMAAGVAGMGCDSAGSSNPRRAYGRVSNLW